MENTEITTTIAGTRVIIVKQYTGHRQTESVSPKVKLIEKRVSLIGHDLVGSELQNHSTGPQIGQSERSEPDKLTPTADPPNRGESAKSNTFLTYGLLGGAAAVACLWLYKHSDFE